jgi:L-lysine exporter family protein LysE/ArgO
MPDAFLSVAAEGFLVGASLIIAIGAQNAFVLKQGLQRSHVFPVALTCALADAALIAAGVGGLGTLVRAVPGLLTAVTALGALFLAAYGARAGWRAIGGGSLDVAGGAQQSLRTVLTTCLALTFLNPHVYLDTVVLIGALSARHAPPSNVAFGAGAALASATWFFALAYGARLLAPLFARPLAWRLLDAMILVVMWVIAGRLVADLLST